MNTKLCPTCKTPIPAHAPGGFCPACILRDADELPPLGRAAPSLAEVSAAFPQLEVLGLIGQGGMGFVYKVRQPSLDRTVALKILSPELSRDPAFAERFAREARVLGKLNHPNIVSVFESGESGGFFYLLMEFVDGVNLRQAMRAGRFTPQQALAVVPGICDALQAAHAQGVWHRDIKPENILLDAQGGVKIVDFGIARLVGDPQRDFTLTVTGAALGSAAYMAPEQHEKPHDVDHRADIYSLGVVIYEMLTGELPLGRFPAPSARAAVDARIDEIVFRTLEKERELRQQSADEVKTDVHRAASAPAATSTATSNDVARERVNGPALGLIVTAILNLLFWGTVLANLQSGGEWRTTPEGDTMSYTAPNSSASITVRNGSPLNPVGVIAVLFVSSALILAGALQMRRLRSYKLSIAAAVLGILTPPGMLIGALFGIWALIALSSRKVRSAYDRLEAPTLSTPRQPFTSPSPLTLWSLGLMVGGGVMFGASMRFTHGSTQGVLLTFATLAIVMGFVAALLALAKMGRGEISTAWRSGLRCIVWAPLVGCIVAAVSWAKRRKGGQQAGFEAVRRAAEQQREADQLRYDAETAQAQLKTKFPDFSTPQGVVVSYELALESKDTADVLAAIPRSVVGQAVRPGDYAKELIAKHHAGKITKEDEAILIFVGTPQTGPQIGAMDVESQKRILGRDPVGAVIVDRKARLFGRNPGVQSVTQTCVKEGSEWRVIPNYEPSLKIVTPTTPPNADAASSLEKEK